MHETCSTHDNAFADYGIQTGTDLVHRTHYRLRDREYTDPAATPAFLDALEKSFQAAYVDAAAVPIVPEPVAAAIDDARTAMAHRLLDGGADGDLRSDVVPDYYRLVASYYCEYRDEWSDDGLGIEFGGRR
jgi:hypothetical protein